MYKDFQPYYCKLTMHLMSVNYNPDVAVTRFYVFFSLKGDKIYTYKGDRVREDILDFARRLEGLVEY